MQRFFFLSLSLCLSPISVDLLQMLEMNMTIAFPAAPLLTVILALVGELTRCRPLTSSHSAFTQRVVRRDWHHTHTHTHIHVQSKKKLPHA